MIVIGLVGGYVPGALAGALVSLPAVLMSPHEWLTFPLMIGVGALVASEIVGEQSSLLKPFRYGRYAAGELHPVSNSPFPWS